MESFRILLADDHKMFRHGVRKIIEEKATMEVIAEVEDGLELLELLKEVVPDLVILDISMPNMRGIEAANEIKTLYPEIKILILTMHNDKEYLHHALAAGVEGYLLKGDSEEELFTAIEKIRLGDFYVSPFFAHILADDFVQFYQGKWKPYSDPLTKREREVIKLIAEGKTSKEVAELLYISVRTAEHHRANIMGKLNLKTTSSLVKYALLKGYTSPTP